MLNYTMEIAGMQAKISNLWQFAAASFCRRFFSKTPLQMLRRVLYLISLWGISAAGSAQHWQCWGQEFESPMLHQSFAVIPRGLRRIFMFRCLEGWFCTILSLPGDESRNASSSRMVRQNMGGRCAVTVQRKNA